LEWIGVVVSMKKEKKDNQNDDGNCQAVIMQTSKLSMMTIWTAMHTTVAVRMMTIDDDAMMRTRIGIVATMNMMVVT
jgi:hypothetical protein